MGASRRESVITAELHIECDPLGHGNRFPPVDFQCLRSQELSMLGSRDTDLGHFCVLNLKVLRLRFAHDIEMLISQQKMKEKGGIHLPFTHSSHCPCGLHTEIARCCCYLAVLGAAKRERSRERWIGVWGCRWVGRVRKASVQGMDSCGGDGRSGEIKGDLPLRLHAVSGGACDGRCWKVGLAAMFK